MTSIRNNSLEKTRRDRSPSPSLSLFGTLTSMETPLRGGFTPNPTNDGYPSPQTVSLNRIPFALFARFDVKTHPFRIHKSIAHQLVLREILCGGVHEQWRIAATSGHACANAETVLVGARWVRFDVKTHQTGRSFRLLNRKAGVFGASGLPPGRFPAAEAGL